MSEADRGLSLASVIAQARAELELARAEGTQRDVQFQVEEMELELAVEVSGSASVDAGVRFWVLSAGAKGEVRHLGANHVRIKLKPVGPGGTDLQVGSGQLRRPDGSGTEG
jgi:Trypsin-co-occurring domain 2